MCTRELYNMGIASTKEERLVSAGFRGGRTCFGWFQGGKDWFRVVSCGKDWFRVVSAHSAF